MLFGTDGFAVLGAVIDPLGGEWEVLVETIDPARGCPEWPGNFSPHAPVKPRSKRTGPGCFDARRVRQLTSSPVLSTCGDWTLTTPRGARSNSSSRGANQLTGKYGFRLGPV